MHTFHLTTNLSWNKQTCSITAFIKCFMKSFMKHLANVDLLEYYSKGNRLPPSGGHYPLLITYIAYIPYNVTANKRLDYSIETPRSGPTFYSPRHSNLKPTVFSHLVIIALKSNYSPWLEPTSVLLLYYATLDNPFVRLSK